MIRAIFFAAIYGAALTALTALCMGFAWAHSFPFEDQGALSITLDFLADKGLSLFLLLSGAGFLSYEVTK